MWPAISKGYACYKASIYILLTVSCLLISYEKQNIKFTLRMSNNDITFKIWGFHTHPASYSIGNRTLTPGLKWPGRAADHSPPSSAEVKNEWRYTTSPPTLLRTWGYHISLCIFAVFTAITRTLFTPGMWRYVA
jgi:hypothetical protein